MRGRRSISSDSSSVGGGSDSNDDLAATTNDDDDSTWLELDDLVPLSIDTPDYTITIMYNAGHVCMKK